MERSQASIEKLGLGNKLTDTFSFYRYFWAFSVYKILPALLKINRCNWIKKLYCFGVPLPENVQKNVIRSASLQ